MFSELTGEKLEEENITDHQWLGHTKIGRISQGRRLAECGQVRIEGGRNGWPARGTLKAEKSGSSPGLGNLKALRRGGVEL